MSDKVEDREAELIVEEYDARNPGGCHCSIPALCAGREWKEQTAELKAENARLREALEKIAGMRYSSGYGFLFDVADEALDKETVEDNEYDH